MISFRAEDVFLVTGASSGLGASVALTFNELGATVLAGGRDKARLEETRARAARPDFFYLEPRDLAQDMEALPVWLTSLKNKYGKMRGLVHSAGQTLTRPLKMMDYATAKSLFDINYFVALLLARGFSDRRVNTGNGSSLTFIASTAAHRPARGLAAYAGSKAALVATAKALALETAPQGLRVNSISPAFVDTPMARAYWTEFGAKFDAYPLGLGRPEDVAALAVFLASDGARWITGQNYILDGGAGV